MTEGALDRVAVGDERQRDDGEADREERRVDGARGSREGDEKKGQGEGFAPEENEDPRRETQRGRSCCAACVDDGQFDRLRVDEEMRPAAVVVTDGSAVADEVHAPQK